MKNTFNAIAGVAIAAIGLVIWAIAYFSAKEANKNPEPGTIEYARKAKEEKKKNEESQKNIHSDGNSSDGLVSDRRDSEPIETD